jgi:hypothetical protein
MELRRNTFAAKSPFAALLWTGGAPLLHPEIETMIEDPKRTYLQEPSLTREIGCIQDAPYQYRLIIIPPPSDLRLLG